MHEKRPRKSLHRNESLLWSEESRCQIISHSPCLGARASPRLAWNFGQIAIDNKYPMITNSRLNRMASIIHCLSHVLYRQCSSLDDRIFIYRSCYNWPQYGFHRAQPRHDSWPHSMVVCMWFTSWNRMCSNQTHIWNDFISNSMAFNLFSVVMWMVKFNLLRYNIRCTTLWIEN